MQVRFSMMVGLAVSAMAFVSAQAATISVQFRGTTTSNELFSADTAGVVPTTNWNSLTGSSFAGVALKSDLGPSSATLSGNAGTGGYFAGNSFPTGSGDNRLLAGELYNGDVTTTTNIATVAAVPYATYDVYVYGASDANGRPTTFTLTPLGGTASSFSLNSTSGLGTYVQSTNTFDGVGAAPTLPTANYVVFRNITTTGFNLKFGAPGNGGMNGFEIVQVVPEPTSLAVAGLALGGLAARRRR